MQTIILTRADKTVTGDAGEKYVEKSLILTITIPNTLPETECSIRMHEGDRDMTTTHPYSKIASYIGGNILNDYIVASHTR